MRDRLKLPIARPYPIGYNDVRFEAELYINKQASSYWNWPVAIIARSD